MDQVNLNLARALARPGTAADIVLQPGDSLYVPEYLPTVRVSGAVVAPSSVQYVAGRNARYYIENAGGFAANADEGRTVVRFANGSARTRSRFLFFTSWPEPGPGAEVFVPAKAPKEPANWLPVLAAVASILASTASVVIAISSTSGGQ
jgi:protein involved in polysaccharide export with SLBB domain